MAIICFFKVLIKIFGKPHEEAVGIKELRRQRGKGEKGMRQSMSKFFLDFDCGQNKTRLYANQSKYPP